MTTFGFRITINHLGKGKRMLGWIKSIFQTIGIILLLAIASGLIAAVFFTEKPETLF